MCVGGIGAVSEVPLLTATTACVEASTFSADFTTGVLSIELEVVMIGHSTVVVAMTVVVTG